MEKTIIHTAYVSKDYKVVPTTIEVAVSAGIGIHLVGLRDDAVKESLLRICTALQSCGYHIPGRKVIINVSPAVMDKRDNSAVLDLPIAIGILQASGQISASEDNEVYTPCGELALDGTIRHPLYNLADAVHNIEQNQK